MVDADRAEARIERLEELIERLEGVRLYMEVDDRAVFASLAFLDDLRQFAAFAQGRIS